MFDLAPNLWVLHPLLSLGGLTLNLKVGLGAVHGKNALGLIMEVPVERWGPLSAAGEQRMEDPRVLGVIMGEVFCFHFSWRNIDPHFLVFQI